MLEESTRQAIAAADRGDVGPLQAARERGTDAPGAQVALHAVAYLAGLTAQRPSLLAGPSESSLHIASIAVVERDAELLRAALSHAAGADPLRLQTYELWLDFEEGSSPERVARARELEKEASRVGRAPLVVELAALRACALLRLGELGDAVVVGRRASRMSRTEAFPQKEYLANVIFARIRRASGRPHLALRILSALRRMVSPAWHEWVDTERILSGGAVTESPGRVSLWQAAIDGAKRGDRAAFAGALATLGHDSGSALVREDASVLRCLVDPRFDPASGPPLAAAWRRTERSLAPGGMHAVADLGGDHIPTNAAAYVLLYPDGQATRISSLGLPLLGRPWVEQSTGKRSGGRLAAALPILAAAGPEGLREEELFRSVYGFGFRKQLHQNALNILLHRIRGDLNPAATLQREKGQIRLTTTTVLAVPDGRCDRPVEDRLLRYLSQQRGATARSAAAALGVPLRSAQAVLEELVEDGACLREGAGRATTYAIEDTTFREPTAGS